MTYRTAKGTLLTDELLDEWAEACERGEYPGTPGEIVVGRPRISAEDLATITFKLPKSQVAALDETAKRAGETRSQFLRSLVNDALARG
ncbi:CopG family transcriptional regulator [Eggerthella guodeyinii]|uniref:CopG family transcriptional regulator n=1 Tax=Eggerthella guodeyinii TaxID=2690837 RepID=A0A6L7IU29_9ACTN|nr:ribbon-helix-helix domain-containing protein [Eggerthella guodeyinii]QOS69135.1 CopG family transcriptional regulator [Eggerthella guodeyinii]